MCRKSRTALGSRLFPPEAGRSMPWFGRFAIVAFLVLQFAPAAVAVQPDEMLADPRLETRARTLSRELRCMVCQNQSIDDSEAPLARDLRILVRERLQAGDSDAQVLDFLTARYGEFVLLKPPFARHTPGLWLAPSGGPAPGPAPFRSALRFPASVAPAGTGVGRGRRSRCRRPFALLCSFCWQLLAEIRIESRSTAPTDAGGYRLRDGDCERPRSLDHAFAHHRGRSRRRGLPGQGVSRSRPRRRSGIRRRGRAGTGAGRPIRRAHRRSHAAEARWPIADRVAPRQGCGNSGAHSFGAGASR